MWTAVFLFLSVAILMRVLWRRWRYDLHKIPSPPGLPLLGHTFHLMHGKGKRNPIMWTGEALKQLRYPKLMRVDVMGVSQLVLTDDHFAKTVMLSSKDPFPRTENGAFVLPMAGNDMGAKSLILASDASPYVKAVRRVYATAMRSDNLRAALPRIQGVMQNMLSDIELRRESGPIDIQKLSVSMTLDAIGAVAFDANLGGLDRSRNLRDLILAAGYIGRKSFTNPLYGVYCKLFPNSHTAQHRLITIERLNTEWKRLTDEILQRDAPASGEEPIWHGLKCLVDPETRKPISYNSLLAEIATVVIAGMDTTGHQLAWILALLATRPDIAEKIVEELKHHGLYGEGARDVDFEDLAELTYLTSVVKDGLRLVHIGGGSFPRKVPRDMTILGYRVPKGTRIGRAGPRAFQVDTDWNDAETFNPERWLVEDELSHKWNMMFSTGPRDCAGKKLAVMEIRLGIITLLQRYQISLAGSFQDLFNNVRTGLAVEAADGIWINCKPNAVL